MFNTNLNRWTNKVAVVTGASSGIGAAVCKDLVAAGMTVVGLARRIERIVALREEIESDGSAGRLLALHCDVSKDEDIARAFEWIAAEVGPIHVLVNNAGIIRWGSITGSDSDSQSMKQTLQTNLWGSIECTRKAVQWMKRSNVVGAHIFLINSVTGHKVTNIPAGSPQLLNVYPATKHGMTALAEVLRLEFNDDRLQYKVTSISPGAVRTEIWDSAVLDQLKCVLKPEDVSYAVLFALSTPPEVQISELVIKPVGELF